jgi:hypothetical protein
VNRDPTYTAEEVKQMCLSMELDRTAFQVLQELVDSEMYLYSPEDLPILMQASIIMFSRTMLKLSVKNMN